MQLNYKQKLILKVAIFILATIVIALGLYFLFFRKPLLVTKPTEEPTETPTDLTTLPSAQTGAPSLDTTPTSQIIGLPPSQVADGGPVITRQLTTSGIQSPNLTGGDTITYYNPLDGKIYQIDKNGNSTEATSTVFPNAESVDISKSGEIAAIEFPDGSNIIYNLETNNQTTLPQHWEEFGFSEDSQTIASKSLGVDINNRALITTSADGTTTEVIASLGTNSSAVSINWSPTGDVVGFSRTGETQSGFGREQIYLIGKDGEDAGAIVVEGGNFSAIWSPGGTHILYSVAETSNSYRPSLWYTRGSGGQVGSERKKFSVETWVEKCTFYSNSTIYCAVPRSVPNQSGYQHSQVTEPDDVYSIDINTGRVVLIGSPAINQQMFNLFVDETKETLYFTDRSDRLYNMRLK